MNKVTMALLVFALSFCASAMTARACDQASVLGNGCLVTVYIPAFVGADMKMWMLRGAGLSERFYDTLDDCKASLPRPDLTEKYVAFVGVFPPEPD